MLPPLCSSYILNPSRIFCRWSGPGGGEGEAAAEGEGEPFEAIAAITRCREEEATRNEVMEQAKARSRVGETEGERTKGGLVAA